MAASEVPLYQSILDTAVKLVGADAASLQVIDEEREELRLVASRGLDPASAAFWQFVGAGSATACGVALAARERFVATDVEDVDEFRGTEDLREFRRSRLRAVQSTPLLAADGRVLGMLSTHWRLPHTPDPEELRRIDVLADAVHATRPGSNGAGGASGSTKPAPADGPLRDLAQRVRDEPEHLPRHCAWCDRVEIDGEFVRSAPSLRDDLSPVLKRATSGICPECLARELHNSARARASRAER